MWLLYIFIYRQAWLLLLNWTNSIFFHISFLIMRDRRLLFCHIYSLLDIIQFAASICVALL